MEGRLSGPRRILLVASFMYMILSSLSESLSSGRGILNKHGTDPQNEFDAEDSRVVFNTYTTYSSLFKRCVPGLCRSIWILLFALGAHAVLFWLLLLGFTLLVLCLLIFIIERQLNFWFLQ